jgi:hypothetical protein
MPPSTAEYWARQAEVLAVSPRPVDADDREVAPDLDVILPAGIGIAAGLHRPCRVGDVEDLEAEPMVPTKA